VTDLFVNLYAMCFLRKLFILVLLLFPFLKVKAGIGFSDWQCITPGKNTIDNYSGAGISLFMPNGIRCARVDNLERWYFYRSFIVGNQKNNWFIVNEKTFEVYSYNDEHLWLNAIAKQHLQPVIWTRWYNGNWTFYSDWGFSIFLVFPLSIFLMLIFVIVCYRSARYEKFNVKRPMTITTILLIVAVFLIYLSEQFPQSV
jgi:hypothetical protein